MPPFFGNATTAPTAFGRAQALTLITPAGGTVVNSLAPAALPPGGQFEFDLGSGFIRRASQSGNLTCDVSLVGPIVGGRDQAGAFANNSWVYIYAVLKSLDLATVGLIASANKPGIAGVGSGPSGLLQLGYQSPIYIGAVRMGAGTLLASSRQNRITLTSPLANIAANTATNPTTVQTTDISALVPPLASAVRIEISGDLSTGHTTYATATPGSLGILQIAGRSSAFNDDFLIFKSQVQVNSVENYMFGNGWVSWDSLNTSIYWLWTLTGARTSGTTFIAVSGWEEAYL